MVEKLPLDFVRKIYNMLTNGNDDVNFYCMCIQNQNREAATNSPIKFALNLIKINILCRLPFSKQRLFSEEIGKAYLSGIFVRPAICELASGMLDNSRLITDIFGCAVTTIKSRNEYVKAKLCDLKHQQKGFHDEKAVDFSIYNALKNIIPDKVPVLLEFFGNIKTVIKSSKKICLFLTQDLNTLKIKDLDLQELTTTTLVDYFCPDCKLIIKPHPKDRWQNYKRIFPNAVILEKSVPSELLPFAIDGEIDTVLTASSTSIRGVSEFANRAYSFTTEIETHRERIDSMFALTEVLKQLGINEKVAVGNINEEQMLNFLDNAGIKANGNDIQIDGGINKTDSTELANCRILFCLNLGSKLNYGKAYGCRDKFVIKAKFVHESDSLFEESEHLIFTYSNDTLLSEKLSEINIRIKLYHSKAEVEINCEKITSELDEKFRAELLGETEQEEIL